MARRTRRTARLADQFRPAAPTMHQPSRLLCALRSHAALTLLCGLASAFAAPAPAVLEATLQPYLAAHYFAGAVTLVASPEKVLGHAGAYSSSTVYDRDTRLITVFLVQQVRWEKGGEKILPAFQKAAAAVFSPVTAKEIPVP